MSTRAAISRVLWVSDEESVRAVAREHFGPDYHIERIGLVRISRGRHAAPRIIDSVRYSPFRVRVRPIKAIIEHPNRGDHGHD